MIVAGERLRRRLNSGVLAIFIGASTEQSSMDGDHKNPMTVLKQALLQYGDTDPEKRVRQYSEGDLVIREGASSDYGFLIKSGALRVFSNEKPDKTLDLRHDWEIIGETAFLQPGAPRGASVEVLSPTAELIFLSREDLYGLLPTHPTLEEAIVYLWQLHYARLRDTFNVLNDRVTVRTALMSALLADIHNFTRVSESV